LARWWFQAFLFSALFGEDSHFDEYFSDGLKPPTRLVMTSKLTVHLVISDLKQTSDLGYLQACLLAGLAMKFRWRKWYVRNAQKLQDEGELDQSLSGRIYPLIFIFR